MYIIMSLSIYIYIYIYTHLTMYKRHRGLQRRVPSVIELRRMTSTS